MGEGAPSDVAITPDGSTAYVPSDQLTPIDVATNTAGASIPVSGAYGIAISPTAPAPTSPISSATA